MNKRNTAIKIPEHLTKTAFFTVIHAFNIFFFIPIEMKYGVFSMSLLLSIQNLEKQIIYELEKNCANKET